jgi:putative hydrolase of the HAD superfamily
MEIPMKQIKAIGFDLFNTLIFARQETLGDAMDRLVQSLSHDGVSLDFNAFRQAYRDAVMKFVREAGADGRETHNRFWISAALNAIGYTASPDDTRISRAVEAYFSAFYDHCRLIPDTLEMLNRLNRRFRLALLSNFTHPPAARGIMERLGLAPFFNIVLISGDLGYRKPHPSVFSKLIERLGVEGCEVLYIGDDPIADVAGARQAGINPVWMTHVKDQKIPIVNSPLSSSNGSVVDDDVPRISQWQDLLDLL